MEYRPLGSSGLEASILAFGAWQLGDPEYWGEDSQADGAAAVHAAIDAGINLFDTAEMYGGGESERALGRALRGKRDQVLVASKVLPTHCTPDKLRAACEASLQRLDMEWIDLYQVHWPFRDVPFEDAYGELGRLRDEGKIRAIGVSNFGAQDLDDWMRVGDAATNQLGYNLVFRAIEWEIVPACLRHGVGILVYMPLLQGLLSNRWKTADELPPARRRTRHFSSGRPEVRHGCPGCEDLLFETLRRLGEVAEGIGQSPATVALAWAAAQPGVTSVIVGARNPVQLLRNVEAAGLELDATTLATLDEITRPLKDYFGTNADMWQSGDHCRIR
ncbi:MAG: aldo/keto reductase [Nitrospiraceae bacterium]|nr:aldo/keto reductase [Nitrospiraceae bacterium]